MQTTSLLQNRIDCVAAPLGTASARETRPSRSVALEDAADQNAERIIAAALEILDQGETLLLSIGPEPYTARVPIAFNASIGGHYRHCLDHFGSFLRALDSNEVDYDHRDRDRRVESDSTVALAQTRQIREALVQLAPMDLARSVQTRCEISYVPGRSPLTKSTYGREIVYVIAHAIHHYALISIMARLMDVNLPPEFGIAPSTVAYQKTASASAQ